MRFNLFHIALLSTSAHISVTDAVKVKKSQDQEDETMFGQIANDFAYSGDWSNISTDDFATTATGLSQVQVTTSADDSLSDHEHLDHHHHTPHYHAPAPAHSPIIIKAPEPVVKSSGPSNSYVIPLVTGIASLTFGVLGGGFGGYFFNEHKHEKVEKEQKIKEEEETAARQAEKQGVAEGAKLTKENHVKEIEKLKDKHQAKIEMKNNEITAIKSKLFETDKELAIEKAVDEVEDELEDQKDELRATKELLDKSKDKPDPSMKAEVSNTNDQGTSILPQDQGPPMQGESNRRSMSTAQQEGNTQITGQRASRALSTAQETRTQRREARQQKQEQQKQADQQNSTQMMQRTVGVSQTGYPVIMPNYVIPTYGDVAF